METTETPALKHAPDNDDGFTLLEILVVVAIMGLLIGLVAPAVMRNLGNAKVSIAQQSLERLKTVLNIYKLDVGSYPTTEQGLQALIAQPTGVTVWSGPYLEKEEATPLDPWGHSYLYRSPSAKGDKEYELCSRGPKGQSDEASPDMMCIGS